MCMCAVGCEEPKLQSPLIDLHLSMALSVWILRTKNVTCVASTHSFIHFPRICTLLSLSSSFSFFFSYILLLMLFCVLYEPQPYSITMAVSADAPFWYSNSACLSARILLATRPTRNELSKLSATYSSTSPWNT
jgi:hypothetical protein